MPIVLAGGIVALLFFTYRSDRGAHAFSAAEADRFETVPVEGHDRTDVYDLRGKDGRQYVLTYDPHKNVVAFSAMASDEQYLSAIKALGLTR